jgi:hypothetical protein
MTTIHAELHARENKDADFVTGSFQRRIPVHPVVISYGENVDPSLGMCLNELFGKLFVRFPTTRVPVPLLMVCRGVDLKVAEVEARV